MCVYCNFSLKPFVLESKDAAWEEIKEFEIGLVSKNGVIYLFL